jgi:SM-20-related protein
MNRELYEKITDALVKKGYIVIENALDPPLAKRLHVYAQSLSELKQAGISATNSQHIDSTKRCDKTQWLEEDSAVQSEFLAFTSELQTYLNRALYLGLNNYESHFAIYEKDDFYETHLDAFKNSKNRVITTVYYLNDGWNREDGGALKVYTEEKEFLTEVTPLANTLVIFLSEKFPHEVLVTNKTRYSIAGWFRVDGNG